MTKWKIQDKCDIRESYGDSSDTSTRVVVLRDGRQLTATPVWEEWNDTLATTEEYIECFETDEGDISVSDITMWR